MKKAKMRLDLNDLIVNIVASAVVTLGMLIIKPFFPRLDTDILSLIASIAILLVMLIIHYFRTKGFFTSEPIILPLVIAMIAILVIWVFAHTGLATIEESIQIPPYVLQSEHIGKSPSSTVSLFVYPDYDPSGYMGDIGDIAVEKDPELVRFTYETKGLGPHEWEYKYINGELNLTPCQFAGVMYLNPPNNWGEDANGGFDLRNTRHVIKWEARSNTGKVNVEFVIGGVVWKWDDKNKERIAVPYPDSMSRLSLGTKTLTEEWQPFEVDLSYVPEDNFVAVVGGFAWIISWGSNQVQVNKARTGSEQPKTFTIEIRNIRYER